MRVKARSRWWVDRWVYVAERKARMEVVRSVRKNICVGVLMC